MKKLIYVFTFMLLFSCNNSMTPVNRQSNMNLDSICEVNVATGKINVFSDIVEDIIKIDSDTLSNDQKDLLSYILLNMKDYGETKLNK